MCNGRGLHRRVDTAIAEVREIDRAPAGDERTDEVERTGGICDPAPYPDLRARTPARIRLHDLTDVVDSPDLAAVTEPFQQLAEVAAEPVPRMAPPELDLHAARARSG